jgi:hypothetical protein
MTTPDSDKKVIAYRLDSIDKNIDAINRKIDHNFVTKDTYSAEMGGIKDDVKYLKNLVYGAVATFIALAIGAIITNGVLK